MHIDKRVIIIILILAWGVQRYISGLNDPTLYKGYRYSVVVPEGWVKKTADNTVVFESPQNDFITDEPEASFSVYSKRVEGSAMLLDIAFSDLITSYQQSGWKILDKGEIKIDGQITKWMLCQPDDPDQTRMLLSFYLLDDYNNLMRMEYSTLNVELFDKYRLAFEKFKDSMKLKSGF